MSSGFLYVLVNQAMPGLIKVGKTTRSPSERVAELSSATGVPSPFVLLYQQPVEDCHSAERWVHEQLDVRGCRHARNREFFDAPLHEIVALIYESSKKCESASVDSEGDAIELIDQRQLADELYEQARRLEAGCETKLPNPDAAWKVYEQASQLGHRLAREVVLNTYIQTGYYQAALDICSSAVKSGDWTAEARRAAVLECAGQLRLAIERRAEFFRLAAQYIDQNALSSEAADIVADECQRYVMAVIEGRSAEYVEPTVLLKLASVLVKRLDEQILELNVRLMGEQACGEARAEKISVLRIRNRLNRMTACAV